MYAIDMKQGPDMRLDYHGGLLASICFFAEGVLCQVKGYASGIGLVCSEPDGRQWLIRR